MINNTIDKTIKNGLYGSKDVRFAIQEPPIPNVNKSNGTIQQTVESRAVINPPISGILFFDSIYKYLKSV